MCEIVCCIIDLSTIFKPDEIFVHATQSNTCVYVCVCECALFGKYTDNLRMHIIGLYKSSTMNK